MKNLALTMIVIQALMVLVCPLMFGTERKPIGYRVFVSECFDLMVLSLLGGRVIGWW